MNDLSLPTVRGALKKIDRSPYSYKYEKQADLLRKKLEENKDKKVEDAVNQLKGKDKETIDGILTCKGKVDWILRDGVFVDMGKTIDKLEEKERSKKFAEFLKDRMKNEKVNAYDFGRVIGEFIHQSEEHQEVLEKALMNVDDLDKLSETDILDELSDFKKKIFRERRIEARSLKTDLDFLKVGRIDRIGNTELFYQKKGALSEVEGA